MVSANKFDCHSPAPVQKPVQVQGSTSNEYGEDGGAVSRNWECDRQEKRREQATCSHARHSWDHSCECDGSLCDSYPQKMRYRLRQHDTYFEPIYVCIRTRSMSSSLWQLCAEKGGQGLRRNSVITCSRTLTHWNTFGLVMRPTFTSRGTLTDKTCVSGALSIHIKFTNPLCMPRKSWYGVRFPRRAWLGLSCLRITSLGRIKPWCSTPSSSLNWEGDDVLFMHSGSNRMELDLTSLQGSWKSCTPSSSIA